MKDQRNNHKSKTLMSTCARVLSLASLCYLLNIGAVDAVNGDKVSFNIFEIDSKLIDIMWCGNTNDIILVQTEFGTVYRSRDKGDSWKKLHSMMHQSGSSVLDEGQTVSIFWVLFTSRGPKMTHFSCMSISPMGPTSFDSSDSKVIRSLDLTFLSHYRKLEKFRIWCRAQ